MIRGDVFLLLDSGKSRLCGTHLEMSARPDAGAYRRTVTLELGRAWSKLYITTQADSGHFVSKAIHTTKGA